jgi:hypothetical protein
MTINYCKLEQSLFAQSTAQRGQLDKSDLIKYGQTIATDQKMEGFFAKFFFFFQSTAKKEAYFINKSVTLIQQVNQGLLTQRIGYLSQTEMKHYLSLLKEGEVLVESSRHWRTIQHVHQFYVFIQDTQQRLAAHWLKGFAIPEDLGNKLEQLDPFKEHGITSLLYELNELHATYLTADFVPLLQLVLGTTRLRDMTAEQVERFKSFLILENTLDPQIKTERLAKTLKFASLIKEIRTEKGLQASQDFQAFFKNYPGIQDFVLSMPAPTEELIQFSTLVKELSHLPVDLHLSHTMAEAIEKLQDKQSARQQQLLKRFGESFANRFGVIETPTMEKLHKIEENFRLVEQNQSFIERLNQALSETKDRKNLDQVLDKLVSEDPLLFHLMERLGTQSQEYLLLGVPSEQIRTFQQHVIQNIAPTTKELTTRFLQGERGIDENFHHYVVQFNQKQLAEAQADWKQRYGIPFVEQLTLDPAVIRGEHHYRHMSQLVPQLAEMDKLFVQIGGDHLKADYGLTFTMHVILSLLRPQSKERVNLETYKKGMPLLLQQLKEIKQQLMTQGVTQVQFEQALHQFLTQSPYARSQEQWFALDVTALEQFSHFFQYQLNRQQIEQFTHTQGSAFASVLNHYLKENEEDVCTGKQSFQSSHLFQASFQEQVHLVLPYLITQFKPFVVLDEEIISDSLLREPLQPENLQLRLANLHRLKNLFAKSSAPHEISLIREFIRHLNPPYLMNLDAPYSKAMEREHTLMKEAIEKLVKFCHNEADKNHVYSPGLLARAVLTLVQSKGKEKDAPNKKLQAVAEECDKIFNGSTIKKFNCICLKLFLKDRADETCKALEKPCQASVIQLVEGIFARLNHTEESLSPAAHTYVKDLTQLVIQLSLTTSAQNFDLIRFLSEEVSYGSLVFDVTEMKGTILPDVKACLINKAKKVQATPSVSVEGLLGMIRENPFNMMQAFIPRFIENLLPAEDKEEVNTIREALLPLGPLVNQSATINNALKYVSVVLPSLLLLTENDQTESLKEEVLKQLKLVSQFNLDELKGATTVAEYEALIEKQGLKAWVTVTNLILGQLVTAHQTLQTNSQAEGAVVEFIRDTLPKLVEDRKTIESRIETLTTWLPIIRRTRLGGWIAQKILTRYVEEKFKTMKSLDAHTKKLILASLKSMIETVFLTAPAVIKNHAIPHYLDFLEKVNTTMHQKAFKPEELFVEILKILQQGIQEGAQYGVIIEEAINYAEKALQTSNETLSLGIKS